MTDTWQSAPAAPVEFPSGDAERTAVSPYEAGTGGGRQAPSRTKLLAGAGVGVVALAGAWLAFGGSGGTPAAAPLKPVVHKVVPKVTAPVAEVIPQAPTSGLDLGAAPRLADAVPEIEQFVEEARGHRFKQHVPVTPLADKAFVKALRATEKPSGNADQQAYTSLKALHLVPAALNTSAPVPDSAYADIVGFYDFTTKKLYVRGTTVNPLVQSVVAHELTHALDDQYFDLAKVQKAGKDDSDQSEALLSLIEGDARSVENRFSNALTPQRLHQQDLERAAYFKHIAVKSTDIMVDPGVLSLYSIFPYDLGSLFVDAVTSTGGRGAVDKAFASPPGSTLDILDPQGRYRTRVATVNVAAPKAAGTVVDHDTLGPLGLASLLAESNPDSWPLKTVVEGWRGDSYVTVRNGATACVHDAIATSSAKANTALAKALHVWSAGHPGTSVTATSKTGLLLVSCQG